MARTPYLDDILRDWPYEPSSVSVRMAKGRDGRQVIQMRIEMGVLQLETHGRPDGDRPGGCPTFFDFLVSQALLDEALVMSDEQCAEADREFVQFYHRRICWLAIRQFEQAMHDADHTLGLMDFCRAHSPDDAWTMTHEQYRPFVLFHRVQAAALKALEDSAGEAAIEEINRGLHQLRELYPEDDEEFQENELVQRLVELRESVREKFRIGRTLQEQLSDAVAAEQYELAARLRDQLAERSSS